MPSSCTRTTRRSTSSCPLTTTGPSRIPRCGLAYPEHLSRWQPLYKWFLAIPQYFVLAGLAIVACLSIIAGFVTVVLTGEYPERIRDFLVSAHRYALRVEAYVGFLTDRYPPFSLAA